MRAFLTGLIGLSALVNTLACNYTLDLHDTFGDGWNGNTCTIQVNGVNVLTNVTVNTGSDASFNFTANNGDVVNVIYNATGSWASENEISITSVDLAAVVYTDGMGGTTPAGGTFSIGVNCGLAPPVNNDPCNAQNLPMTGICNPTISSVNGATPSGIAIPTCGNYTTQGDVWFTTNVGASGRLLIELEDLGIDASMALYTGTCAVLNEQGCSASNSLYTDVIAPGTQVWIRVWDSNNSIGSFSICTSEPPPPPVNISPCTATNLTVSTTCVNTVGTTASAVGSSVANSTCSWGYNGGDVWYTATVPASGFMHVNLTAGGLVDGGIAVYSGPDCNNLIEVACNESTWDMPTPVVITPANALTGQQVWIRVWEGDNDNPGTFEICLVDEPVLFVDPTTYTPQELVEDILITGCLQAFNVTYDGDPTAIAYFEGGQGTFGMSSGVVLGSGSAVSLTGQGPDDVMGQETANAAVENDLSDMAQSFGGADDMHDEVILEFDFIPSSDTTRFDFVFASSEYPNFEHTSFNDVFAFFVSGPGINGPYADNAINVALVPGTNDPITISSVNGPVADGGSGDNSAYFAAYTNGAVPNFNVGGYTVPITALMAGLTPCQTYHIKFAIADAGDGSLSSFVFFEESSFSSGGDLTMQNFTNIGAQNEIFEGCENYYVFSRIDTSAIALQDTVPIILNIGGTATEGVDYTAISDTLFLLPGVLSDTIFYAATFDNIVEGTEYILFTLLNGCPCSMTSTNDTIWIRNNYHLDATILNDQLVCFGNQATITTTVNPNIDPLLITYLWNTGETTSQIVVNPPVTTTYTVEISNICEANTILQHQVEVVPTIDPNFTMSKDTACLGEPVIFNFAGFTTSFAQYFWDFTNGTPATGTIAGPLVSSWNNTGFQSISLNIDDRGCINDTSLTIYIKSFENLNLAVNTQDISCFNACDGEGTVQAQSGQAPFSYIWSNGQTTQNIQNLCTGSYLVTVSDVYGCQDTTHLNISSSTALSHSVSTTDANCYGSSDGVATVTISGGVAPYQVAWSNGFVGQTNPNLALGNYAYTITDANGCVGTQNNVQIGQPSQLVINISGTQYNNGQITICNGQTETITSSVTGGVGPYQIYWSTGESTNAIQVNPLLSTLYSLSSTDAHGCPSEVLNFNVFVRNLLTLNSNASSSIVCEGTPITIHSLASGGKEPYSFSMNYGGQVISIDTNYTFIPNQSGTIEVTVSDVCGTPVDVNTFEITVNPNPVAAILADEYSGCPPFDLKLIETSSNSYQSYYWEVIYPEGGGEVSFESSPEFTLEQSNRYHIKLTVVDANGCIDSITNYNMIHVYPAPSSLFTTEFYTRNRSNPQFYFVNMSDGATNYIWSFGNGDSSLVVNPEQTYLATASDYNVGLLASNQFGCTDFSEQTVHVVEDVTFYMPTAFSPDGDSHNEVFNVKGNGIKEDGFEMQVFDRWGSLIFSTHDIKEGWNGKTPLGSYVQNGSYSWHIRFVDVFGIPHEKSGNINVMR